MKEHTHTHTHGVGGADCTFSFLLLCSHEQRAWRTFADCLIIEMKPFDSVRNQRIIQRESRSNEPLVFEGGGR